MISSKNKLITIKVDKNIYDFMNIFSKKFNVSISKIGCHLISVGILDIDKHQQQDNSFYKRLSDVMREYDLRSK